MCVFVCVVFLSFYLSFILSFVLFQNKKEIVLILFCCCFKFVCVNLVRNKISFIVLVFFWEGGRCILQFGIGFYKIDFGFGQKKNRVTSGLKFRPQCDPNSTCYHEVNQTPISDLKSAITKGIEH